MGLTKPSAIDAPLRILFFDAYPHSLGGAQKATLLLAEELARRGCEVRIATVAAGALPAAARRAGIDAEVLPTPPALSRYGHTTSGAAAWSAMFALPRFWVRFFRSVRRSRPQVVHVNDLRGMMLAGLPARLAGVRVVWHLHAVEDRHLANRLGSQIAHAIVVPTRAVVKMRPELAARRSPTVVGNPVLVDRDPVPPPASPVLTTISRLYPDKGIDVLLVALEQLTSAVPAVRLNVVGGEVAGYEGYRDLLEATAASLEIATAVHFVGEVEDPRPWLDACAVYVHPSRAETFSLAVVEAMAAGRPVVAADVGGISEVVTAEETGVLVAPGATGALADAISALLLDPERAARMGAAGHLRAREHFSLERFAEQIETVYGAVLQDERRRVVAGCRT